MNLAIETKDLVKDYRVGSFRPKTVQALRGASLQVEEGAIFGLLGPNGAGKSTIIKLLLNLLHPTSGEVKVLGQSPASVEARRRIGYLPENPAPYEYLTGREFVEFAGRLADMREPVLSRRVSEVIELVGMADASRLQIRRYSKGMVQRICLAQALVSEPRLLVLDEPTSGLDVLGRQLVRDLIRRERERGTTVLLCSHIIPDVEALCDQVAIIIAGQVLEQGSVSKLLATGETRVELQIENASEAVMRALDPEARLVGARWTAHCADAALSNTLRTLLDQQARVVSVQRSRYSLEDKFLHAIQESNQRVGSRIL